MSWRLFKFYIQANWIKTIVLNFKLLPLCEARKLPILLFGKMDLHIGNSAKVIWKSGEVRFANVLIGNSHSSPLSSFNHRYTTTYLSINGNLIFDGFGQFIGNGSKIKVNNGATLYLGDHVYFNNDTMLSCYNKIIIGANTTFSWSCQIFDTNFHYMVDCDGIIKRKNGEILIGNGSWIGYRSTLQKGTKLDDYTIIASNSVVNKDFMGEPNCVIGGVPAKLLSKGKFYVGNYALEVKLDDFFAQHPDCDKVFVDITNCYRSTNNVLCDITTID